MVRPNHGGFHEANQNQASGLGCTQILAGGMTGSIEWRVTPVLRNISSVGISRFRHPGPSPVKHVDRCVAPPPCSSVLRRPMHGGDCRGVARRVRRMPNTDRPGLHQASTNRVGRPVRRLNRSGTSTRLPGPFGEKPGTRPIAAECCAADRDDGGYCEVMSDRRQLARRGRKWRRRIDPEFSSAERCEATGLRWFRTRRPADLRTRSSQSACRSEALRKLAGRQRRRTNSATARCNQWHAGGGDTTIPCDIPCIAHWSPRSRKRSRPIRCRGGISGRHIQR